jgi:hypothetical protein
MILSEKSATCRDHALAPDNGHDIRSKLCAFGQPMAKAGWLATNQEVGKTPTVTSSSLLQLMTPVVRYSSE